LVCPKVKVVVKVNNKSIKIFFIFFELNLFCLKLAVSSF
jgi:hypothetical protein